MKQVNLWSYFRDLNAVPEEIFVALRSIVGGSTSPRGRKFIIGVPPRFEVGYTATATPWIASTTPLADARIERIVGECAALLDGCRRWVTFPMTGRFRAGGAFESEGLKIRPLTDLNTSTLTSLPANGLVELAHQPSLNAVLVDVAYAGANDQFVNANRGNRAIREAANLLSLASLPSLVRPVAGEDGWTLVWDSARSEILNARLFRGFHHPEIGDHEHVPAVGTQARLPTVQHGAFAAGPMNLQAGELYVAESLPGLLANYAALPIPVRRQADRALTWFSAALRAPGPGAAIVFCATAIEALLPKEKSSVCGACGQPSWKISKRVSAFLDTHASNEMRKQFRDAVYHVRSGLTHGERLYEVDEQLFGLNERSYLDVLTARATTRAALLNWLLAQGKT